MKIDGDLCCQCLECIPYCPVTAIGVASSLVIIDYEKCVECGVCLRAGVCPVEAIVQEELSWPRVIRAVFSDPGLEHKETGIAGRGIEEIKTNDVTRRYVGDLINIAIELGRPGVGTDFSDVQAYTMALALHQIFLQKDNPVFHLLANSKTGELKKDILDERALSVIIDFTFSLHKLASVLDTVNLVSATISTVASVSVAGELNNGAVAFSQILQDMDIQAAETVKLNIGLGR